jgi:hypothetical protein
LAVNRPEGEGVHRYFPGERRGILILRISLAVLASKRDRVQQSRIPGGSGRHMAKREEIFYKKEGMGLSQKRRRRWSERGDGGNPRGIPDGNG